ncbi:hypothetical protein S40285_06443 [Stachybotrys chlorohalonatus IBT 40285]|uniref:Dicer-like protein 2 n=1 Tax=Stachybotrys chlorohalonatus (strain IBT 40285) TaxID=1283841 RepID=A0A084QB68_STAC4|nr:hypothetical protein S40285_06443 [Stachybotrys chlorohalonata IBT 40285]
MVDSDHGSGTLSPASPTPHAQVNETIRHVVDGHVTAPAPAPDTSDGTSRLNPRAYQQEMFDHSLQRNTIVAMDTGSGKTQVAILRIAAELDKASTDKIIWFLAPTVSLCQQQFNVIRLQIPAVSIKIVTGEDNADTWSENIWATLLDGVRIVVTTHQILLDALSHAAIKMSNLSLIIFDEAHCCRGKHPGGKIMTDFYHRQKGLGAPVPAVLGLTASPFVKSRLVDLEILESTLDSKCITPTLHREELVRHVSRPQIVTVVYPTPKDIVYTPSMASLSDVINDYDLYKDPYVIDLMTDQTEKNIRKLEKVFKKRDSFTERQLQGLYSRSVSLCQQLGPWAADRFLSRTTTTFLNRLDSMDDFHDWIGAEKLYLAELLQAIPQQNSPAPQAQDVSHKVGLLVKELASLAEKVTGIIFVKERATVTMLHELLETCEPISKKFRIGTLVGTSNMPGKRKDIYEFQGSSDPKTLEKFRAGEINLLIATSVLEEGIDVPACNMVICFDEPSTPKSFIQRRGRARMKDSRLVLFLQDSCDILDKWQILEEQLRAQYEDEERQLRQLELLDDSEYDGGTFFEVASTGARLDLDNAKQHLEHFCSVLSRAEFVDHRPDYIIHAIEAGTVPTLQATVLLPSFVPPELRRIEGVSVWRSEKKATKDAAFQAYLALYKAGLISEYLLPFSPSREGPVIEGRPAEVGGESLMNPWPQVAQLWRSNRDIWLYSLSYHGANGEKIGDYGLLLPVGLPRIRTLPIYIQREEVHSVQCNSVKQLTHEEAAKMPDHTATLLALNFCHKWDVEPREQVIKLFALDVDIDIGQIGSGTHEDINDAVKSGTYLIRNHEGASYFYDGMIYSKPPFERVKTRFFGYENAPLDAPYLVLKKYSRRTDFLHPFNSASTQEASSKKSYSCVLPLELARVDAIEVRHAYFGRLIPSIMHELEVMLLTQELAETLLKPVGLSNMELIRTAISSRSAREPQNYEKLEFFGDSFLKYCAVVNVFAKYPKWNEYYLSSAKDRLVSNSRLQRAAVEKGLVRFILTRPFTGQDWRPIYIDEACEQRGLPSDKRKLSTKTIADVVEALIGASYQDGGIGKALKCISVFIDDGDWQDIGVLQAHLFNQAVHSQLPPVLAPLEDLIGYSFRKKTLLVEAMTHASYLANKDTMSLERLEFLGDAVLDYIIVNRLVQVHPPLAQDRMHLIKAALSNKDFLAFITLKSGVQKRETIVTPTLDVKEEQSRLSLWQFMRHMDHDMGLEQLATQERYSRVRGDITSAMESGADYPWTLLCKLHARKFFSDVFEALLGALWIDSGSLEVCESVATRFGILPYMERILRDKVNVRHPKEQMGISAGSMKVTYDVIGERWTQGDQAVVYSCRLFVGDKVVADVKEGVSREEITTRAAEEAVRFMKTEAWLQMRDEQ